MIERKAPAPALLSLFLLVLFLTPVLVGCRRAEVKPTVETYTVSLLVQVSKEDIRWFRDVVVPKGTNAFELTQQVTKGDLKAKWFSQYRSHFVEAIFGVENKGKNFWLTWLWDEGEKKWTPLPVGADLFSLKNGHVLAWSYADTSREPTPPPAVTP